MRKFAAFLFVALVSPAFSATHKIPADEPIATISIPDKWQTKTHEEFVESTAPDGALNFLVMPAERNKIAESMGEAMRYLRNKSGITVRADTRKDEQEKLNGMEVRNVSWQGKNKNGDVKIRFTLVSIAEGKTLLAVYWGSPDAVKKFEGELNKMLQSIKKA